LKFSHVECLTSRMTDGNYVGLRARGVGVSGCRGASTYSLPFNVYANLIPGLALMTLMDTR
jgi:hypothetical protein